MEETLRFAQGDSGDEKRETKRPKGSCGRIDKITNRQKDKKRQKDQNGVADNG